MRPTTLALLLALTAATAQAQGERCKLILDQAATSIASGAITTAAWQAFGGGLRPSMQQRPSYLRVDLDLIDASNGVSVIRLTFTGTSASGGTYRPVSELLGGSYEAALARDWDPRSTSKTISTGKIPWSHSYGKLTATPTGYGAGDTLAIEIYGCTGDAGAEKASPPEWPAFVAGGWTPVDCSAGAAYSAQLPINAWIVLQARGGDAYWAQTAASSGVDADANDGFLPEAAWGAFSTHNGNRYFSCDGSADSATVVWIQVQ